MKPTNFIASALAGTVVYFLLGWVAYGMIFKDLYPKDENTNMVFIFLGCLLYAVMITYIFYKWANISTWKTGAKAGAVIGLLNSLSMNFFMYSSMEADYNKMITDVLITTVMSAILGAVVGGVLGAMNKKG